MSKSGVPSVVQTRSRAAAAHRSAVLVDFSSIVQYLSENLGSRLVGLMAGVDQQTVTRWAADTSRAPRGAAEERVRAAYQIFQELQPAEASPTIRAWFMGMNPQIDDLSPAEAVADGRAREALAAARSFIAGG